MLDDFLHRISRKWLSMDGIGLKVHMLIRAGLEFLVLYGGNSWELLGMDRNGCELLGMNRNG